MAGAGVADLARLPGWQAGDEGQQVARHLPRMRGPDDHASRRRKHCRAAGLAGQGTTLGSDLETVLWILALVALTLIFTGPGLWSEKWGWPLIARLTRKRRDEKRQEGKRRDREPSEPP